MCPDVPCARHLLQICHRVQQLCISFGTVCASHLSSYAYDAMYVALWYSPCPHTQFVQCTG